VLVNRPYFKAAQGTRGPLTAQAASEEDISMHSVEQEGQIKNEIEQ